MRRFLWPVFLFFVLPALWSQQTYAYPSGSPLFSISFPDTWKTQILEDSVITAESPEEGIAMLIWRLPFGTTQEQAVAQIADQLDSSIRNVDFGQARIVTENGIQFLAFDGTAQSIENDAPMEIKVWLFKPEGKQGLTQPSDFFVQDRRSDFLWVYFGTPAAEKTYEEDLKYIVDSLVKK